MTIWLSLLVALIGAVVFIITKNNADVKRLGELSYFAGLLAFLLQFRQLIDLFGR